jgi:hypothetical protein
VLDRQIRDAAPRIEPLRPDDRLRRADLDARGAVAAMRGRRLGQRQREIDVDLAEKEHRAGRAVENQRVLAAPADPAARGELDLEHRRRIGEDAVAERTDLLGERIGQACRRARSTLW